LSNTTTEILTERAKTHGDFRNTAELGQGAKLIWRSESGWSRLTPTQREALDMIASKIARILCGNPHAADHWVDIQGYAQLVAEDLQRQAFSKG
jgi:hypothetical protein